MSTQVAEHSRRDPAFLPVEDDAEVPGRVAYVHAFGKIVWPCDKEIKLCLGNIDRPNIAPQPADHFRANGAFLPVVDDADGPGRTPYVHAVGEILRACGNEIELIVRDIDGPEIPGHGADHFRG